MRGGFAQSCFERIRARFDPGAAFCAIGDGAEERDAAAAIGWPFIHVGMAHARGSPGGSPSAGAQGAGGCALTALSAEAVVRRALSSAASAPPGRSTRPRAEPP